MAPKTCGYESARATSSQRTVMPGSVAVCLTALAALAYALFKHFSRPSLSSIRGPKSHSFFLGNLLEIFHRPAGETDFEWQRCYGDIVRFKTVFGVNQLWIADPKALQRIFNTSAYHYPKPHSDRVTTELLTGKGIVWADGEDHKRQRKVLLPGFGGPESKAFLDIFQRCARSMCMEWLEIISNSAEQNVVMNLPAWISRGALDAIGQAAFDVQFGAVKDDTHPLVTVFGNAVNDIFGRPSAQQVFVEAAIEYIPTFILEWFIRHSSHHRLTRAREMGSVTTDVAKELVREKAESLLVGKGSRDIFSLLVKANMDAEVKNKLTEEELLCQMRTIFFAGHETTSTSLGWLLLELARHPEMQTRLRAEIWETEAAIRARGDTQFTVADFDAMHYTTAVLKEGLRYHSALTRVRRIAGGDDILPLARPITTESGEVIDEIFIPKGTGILVSIAAYNRNKELWGEDAHEFNPDRWLNGTASKKKTVQVGVYSNLMTFLGGTRACLGWRFAVIEIQAFLIEIIGRFELTMTERSARVHRGQTGILTPVVDGEPEYGSQLPLAVSIVAREDQA